MKKKAIQLLTCTICVLGLFNLTLSQNVKEIHDFNLTVFLEGPFNGIDMNTLLFDSGILPVNQPYNASPWDYNGTETLTANPGDDVVDWILVEIMESPFDAASATPDKIIYQEAALLLSDGSIVQSNGSSPIEFDADIQYLLYVIIRHRNHLSILSTSPLTESKGSYEYDFTNELTKAYLNGQKEIATGIYGMIGGDCNANGLIEIVDKSICWEAEAGKMNYLPGDWNLDLQVNNPDKDDIWLANMGYESKVPRAFECGELLTDFRDNQTYNTILIGNQCWMAENLNVGTMIDEFNMMHDNEILEKYCYENDSNNCLTYGALYQWGEMLQYDNINRGTQGICPEGWHIPTDVEWKVLEGTVDSYYNVGHLEWEYLIIGPSNKWRGFNAGDVLKSTSGWDNNGNGSDLFGFEARPSGFRHPFDLGGPTMSYDIGKVTFFWTNTNNEVLINEMVPRILDADSITIGVELYGTNTGPFAGIGISVRCLQDPYNQPPITPTNLAPYGSQISIDTILSWFCMDPEGDQIAYDIYFGSEIDFSYPYSYPPGGFPPLIASGITDTIFDPGILEKGITYFGLIRAYDDQLNYAIIQPGILWNFTTISNQLPSQPHNPVPGDSSVNVSIDTTLSWSCSDPDGDPLNYSIYFGTETDPPIAQLNHPDTFYIPGTLDYNTTYHWKIVAIDSYGDSTIGPIWTFTTLYQSWSCGMPIIVTHTQGAIAPVTKTVTYGTVVTDLTGSDKCWITQNLGADQQAISVDDTTVVSAGWYWQFNRIQGYMHDGTTRTPNTPWDGAINESSDWQTNNDPCNQLLGEGWRIPTQVELETADLNGSWNDRNDAFASVLKLHTAGYLRYTDGLLAHPGEYGYVWNSEQHSTLQSDALSFRNSYCNMINYNKSHGFSVRCINDNLIFNQAPNQPTNPSPDSASFSITIDTTLSWSCSDPDGDPLSYSIYFGTETDPPFTQLFPTDTFFIPGTLEYNTTYYWKIVAIDSYGDSTIGNIWNFTTGSFNCGNALNDSRNGNQYNTIQIGLQCWMAENLNIGTRIDGIQEQSLNNPTELIEKYCFDDLETNCNLYGGLYQWNEMMQYTINEGSQGICPDGWHIPTDEEWKMLEGAVDSDFSYPDPEWDIIGYRGLDAGYNLKSTSGWSSEGNGSYAYNFTALPCGYRNTSGNFTVIGNHVDFWSSTEINSTNAWYRFLGYLSDQVARTTNGSKSYGFSVRCLQD